MIIIDYNNKHRNMGGITLVLVKDNTGAKRMRAHVSDITIYRKKSTSPDLSMSVYLNPSPIKPGILPPKLC